MRIFLYDGADAGVNVRLSIDRQPLVAQSGYGVHPDRTLQTAVTESGSLAARRDRLAQIQLVDLRIDADEVVGAVVHQTVQHVQQPGGTARSGGHQFLLRVHEVMDTPQQPPKNEGIAVSPELLSWIQRRTGLDQEDRDALCDLVLQRCKYGMEKYHQALMSGDGRNDVVDAMQEAGDLLQYAFKARMNGRMQELRVALSPCLTALLVLLAARDEQ